MEEEECRGKKKKKVGKRKRRRSGRIYHRRHIRVPVRDLGSNKTYVFLDVVFTMTNIWFYCEAPRNLVLLIRQISSEKLGVEDKEDQEDQDNDDRCGNQLVGRHSKTGIYKEEYREKIPR